MLTQTSVISEIKPVEISRNRTKIKSDNLNNSELRLYRTLAGNSCGQLIKPIQTQGAIYYVHIKC